MSRRWRVALAVVGLLILVLSLAALVYALTPVDRTQEQFRPEPTLFSPPQSYNQDIPAIQPWASFCEEWGT